MSDVHHYLVDLRQHITDIIDNLDHDQFIAAQRAEFDHDELVAERALADDLATEYEGLRHALIEIHEAAGWPPPQVTESPALARYRATR